MASTYKTVLSVENEVRVVVDTSIGYVCTMVRRHDWSHPSQKNLIHCLVKTYTTLCCCLEPKPPRTRVRRSHEALVPPIRFQSGHRSTSGSWNLEDHVWWSPPPTTGVKHAKWPPRLLSMHHSMTRHRFWTLSVQAYSGLPVCRVSP